MQFSADRLNNLILGLTDTSPDQLTPMVGKYDQCATQVPALGRGEIKEFSCNQQGRYVIVQTNTRNYLTLCEVEVYGGKKHLTYIYVTDIPLMYVSQLYLTGISHRFTSVKDVCTQAHWLLRKMLSIII